MMTQLRDRDTDADKDRGNQNEKHKKELEDSNQRTNNQSKKRNWEFESLTNLRDAQDRSDIVTCACFAINAEHPIAVLNCE